MKEVVIEYKSDKRSSANDNEDKKEVNSSSEKANDTDHKFISNPVDYHETPEHSISPRTIQVEVAMFALVAIYLYYLNFR